MSADNWRACPRCAVAKKREAEKAEEKAGKAYGKVSAEKFLELLKAAEVAKAASDDFGDAESKHTFREDYGIGTDLDGEFSVSYSGGCSVCNYSVKFKHKQAFPPKETGS